MSKYVRKADRVRPGPLARHGGYSVVHKDKLVRYDDGINLYLKIVRRGLIRDLSPEGEEHLTTARRIILDRLMQKLATTRLVEEHLAEHPEVLLREGSPTGLWLSVNNAILKDLLALGLDRKALEVPTLTPAELLAEAALEAEVVEEESGSGCKCKGACKASAVPSAPRTDSSPNDALGGTDE